MEQEICKLCSKRLEGYTLNQVEHLMQQHMLKHEREKRNDKKRIKVYAYVCADPFHIGHLIHLQNSKALGDYLIVGVLNENAIKEKKQAPIFSLKERMALIKGLACVDEVIEQDTYSPLPNALKLKVDILSESTSHRKEDIEEAEKMMRKTGGKVIVMPYYKGQSSTNIKRLIKEKWKN